MPAHGSEIVPGPYGGFLAIDFPAPFRRKLALLVEYLEREPAGPARAALALVMRDRRARIVEHLDDLERLDRERILSAHRRARRAHRLLHTRILQWELDDAHELRSRSADRCRAGRELPRRRIELERHDRARILVRRNQQRAR